jgi:crotonobetainyl-CoA:carnitine CoA-transferase CaiB-like acyl-CoA transferase
LRFSAVVERSALGAPALGAHTAEVLAELGYREKQIDTLGENGVI